MSELKPWMIPARRVSVIYPVCDCGFILNIVSMRSSNGIGSICGRCGRYWEFPRYTTYESITEIEDRRREKEEK